MAPTCYNSMKNLHYRTHSLPESAYTAQLLHSTQPADYQAGTPPKRVRAGVRRSNTSAAELLSHPAHSRPAPLTAGLYEQFLPPPNYNTIGLPARPVKHCNGLRGGQQFYSGHPAHRGWVGHSPYWYHRSVPNLGPASLPNQQRPALPTPSNQQQQPASKSVTSPLFVDCSVEYDLGEQPAIPADSEPLLTIHPDYRPPKLQLQQQPARPRPRHPRPAKLASPQSPWLLYSQAAGQQASTAVRTGQAGHQYYSQAATPQLQQQQTEYTSKLLPSHKRFALTGTVPYQHQVTSYFQLAF